MQWITREHAKVDRVACPWLIRHFVDAEADFLFVPADQVLPTAAATGAIPYDVPAVQLGHHGDACSFEAILEQYGLTDNPALVLLGKIVNGADTDNTRWNQAEGPGLRAIAHGFARLGYADDHALNAAEWIIYDALYAYCQAQVGLASGEAPATVLFICPHGVAKSVMAMALFQQQARQRQLPYRALARGLEPEPAVWPGVIAQLQQDGIDVRAYQPQRLTAADLASAQQVITLGCALPADLPLPPGVVHTDWSDVPLAAQDLPGAYAAIQRHVAAFMATLAPAREVPHG
jgi:protein-tyrosine-phosphatase